MSTAEGLMQLQDDPSVVYATPNHIYHLDEFKSTSTPNDLDKKLWGMKAIHAPEAWAIQHGSPSGPIVAVLDTGVDLNHPDLKANLWTNPREIAGNGLDDDGNGIIDDVHGYYPKMNNGDVQDGHKHGTHTFGTIGAVGNNGLGVTGVNWEGQIMAIKIFDDQGRTDAAMVAKGLEYATNHGARITSNSWGGTVYNPAIEDAFRLSPALHIAAAGNSHINNDLKPHYPSNLDLPNMISVAASDGQDRRASFSNYGLNTVDLAAPGVDIYSTVPGGEYALNSGTSMAAPHVSGAAALIANAHPYASNQDIKNRLLFSTDKVEALKGVVSTGGRLNAASALEADHVAPNAPSNLTLKSASSRGVVLQWTAPGDDGNQGTASQYEVRYSDQPIATDEAFEKATRVAANAPSKAGQKEEMRIDIRPMERDRKLHFAVKAYDNVGNSSPITSLQGKVPAAKVVFADRGPSSWQKDGSWGQVQMPEGGTAWADSPNGNYESNQTNSLTSKPFSLKGVKNTTLVFDARTELEEARDGMWLQVSNDGSSWSPVGSLTGTHPWEPHTVDLSKFDGKSGLQFRFCLVTDNTGDLDGVYLRNIAIVGDPS